MLINRTVLETDPTLFFPRSGSWETTIGAVMTGAPGGDEPDWSADDAYGKVKPRKEPSVSNPHGDGSAKTIRARSRKGELQEEMGRGVTKLFRVYEGHPTSLGLYDEYHEAIAENYEETAKNNSCDATDLEQGKAMFSMLHGSPTPYAMHRARISRRFTKASTFYDLGTIQLANKPDF